MTRSVLFAQWEICYGTSLASWEDEIAAREGADSIYEARAGGSTTPSPPAVRVLVVAGARNPNHLWLVDAVRPTGLVFPGSDGLPWPHCRPHRN